MNETWNFYMNWWSNIFSTIHVGRKVNVYRCYFAYFVQSLLKVKKIRLYRGAMAMPCERKNVFKNETSKIAAVFLSTPKLRSNRRCYFFLHFTRSTYDKVYICLCFIYVYVNVYLGYVMQTIP